MGRSASFAWNSSELFVSSSANYNTTQIFQYREVQVSFSLVLSPRPAPNTPAGWSLLARLAARFRMRSLPRPHMHVAAKLADHCKKMYKTKVHRAWNGYFKAKNIIWLSQKIILLIIWWTKTTLSNPLNEKIRTCWWPLGLIELVGNISKFAAIFLTKVKSAWKATKFFKLAKKSVRKWTRSWF